MPPHGFPQASTDDINLLTNWLETGLTTVIPPFTARLTLEPKNGPRQGCHFSWDIAETGFETVFAKEPCLGTGELEFRILTPSEKLLLQMTLSPVEFQSSSFAAFAIAADP